MVRYQPSDIKAGSSGDELYRNGYRYAPEFHWSPVVNRTTMGQEATEIIEPNAADAP
jgi:hypothetical protein